MLIIYIDIKKFWGWILLVGASHFYMIFEISLRNRNENHDCKFVNISIEIMKTVNLYGIFFLENKIQNQKTGR